ncbi:D-tagatose-bisphosphate aldolase, class II, non-catalytic subunit [Pseudoroseicyclus aestuarii]|uniref:Tagatose-bisphosphate aldolase noncatalytic subunit n=1 Tax=Pseudoroseicyclus aestuarii TaxID=1795041 RepID=A0A318SMA9_9RHOB|nr:D-tagatose-bisphosphate aldolase, class II, non-catalytic subunit [Pseudoroseicyclus aestuarii]PYE81170.1 tagatose-bisphosphate aldolase noncatalytic subunit [Pseudoroseicyclus aestuarii]
MTDTATNRLARIAERRGREGITSVCSAHPLVIEATLRHGLARGGDVLIEATCNQVNQDGGYTGMTPSDFRDFVMGIAARTGFPADRLVLGGDHLGPNPWKALPAEEAMEKAGAMIAAYAEAGFSKLHLDCSMGCAGEPAALDDAVTARRAAQLAARAEAAATGPAPVYVIGTEVPVPGGALEEIEGLQPTTPAAVRDTIEVHRRAFAEAGQEAAFARAIAVVVQPGVEFGSTNIVDYAPEAARDLSAALNDLPQFVYEAHSTDYQTEAALAALVRDGFAILKVGPGLTFALREALYGLSAIAAVLDGHHAADLPRVTEERMLAEPRYWQSYYHGDAAALFLQRHYSLSDRIRYYWPDPQIAAAVEALLTRLEGVEIPLPLIGQHLGRLADPVRAGQVPPQARALLLAAVTQQLDTYEAAIRGA